MAVSYTNNFNNIADKLLEVIKTEMPVPVNKTTATQPYLKANEFIRVVPIGSTIVEYAGFMEEREYEFNIKYIFQDRRENSGFLEHVMNNCSRFEALIHENQLITLADSTRAFNLRLNDMELDSDDDQEGYFVVDYNFTCNHIGNQG